MLLQKGLIPARCTIYQVKYHGWESEEGPGLQMQRARTVFFMLQLHCGLGMVSRQRGFCPPAPAVQQLQFVLSVKPSGSWKAVPSPPVLAQGGWQPIAIACSVICFVNRAQNWSTMLMGTTQMLHAGFAAGAEEDAGSFFLLLFYITHLQPKIYWDFT